jgi:hypothetical protein
MPDISAISLFSKGIPMNGTQSVSPDHRAHPPCRDAEQNNSEESRYP